MVNRNLVNEVKHGPLKIKFDIGEISMNGDVELTVREPNGDRQIYKVNGLAFVGIAFKLATEMMKHLDVVQRTLEEVRG